MASGAEYIRRIREQVAEIDPGEVRRLLDAAADAQAVSSEHANGDGGAAPGIVLIDVREQHEFEDAHIEGARHVPRAHLESRIEGAVPDRSARVVLYCASGQRSALAAATLSQLGYEHVENMTGGITLWRDRGYPFVKPRVLTPEQKERYSRHILIPEVGMEGQQRLLDSKVLLVGAGGLGSPAGLYLAAAGVGTLGIVDDDEVDLSNLQRQILHTNDRVGVPKVTSARETINALNPDVEVVPYKTRLDAGNVIEILDGYDAVVNGADNFPTRYLLNDAAVRLGIPIVDGSILGFDGQVTVLDPPDGPCYRCLYPTPPPAELAPSCGANGVLGVLPGVIGLLQANEVIKLLIGAGQPLVGRLLLFEALGGSFTELKVRRDHACETCGDDAQITELGKFPDYEAFCAAAG